MTASGLLLRPFLFASSPAHPSDNIPAKMRAYPAIFLLLVLAAAGRSVRAQQEPATGAIHGTVVHAASNAPLPGVRVSAESANRVSMVTTTDAAGAFALTGLGPGAYRLTFAARGYVPHAYGQKNPDGAGTPLEVGAGQVIRGLVSRLIPTAGIEGRVRDSNGNPAAGTPVELLRAGYDARGKRTFSPIATVDTDDRGMYRIFWITPGRYFLRAGGRIRISSGMNPVNGRAGDAVSIMEPFAPLYYPNGAAPETAVAIEVRAGSDLQGMDFRLQRQRLFRIQGRVIDAQTGRFPPDADLGISGEGWASSGGDRYRAADGTFEIRDLFPGSYRIVAVLRERQQNPAQPGGGRRAMPSSDFMAIQIVDKDVVDVVLRLLPPVAVPGRVFFEDNARPPQGLSVRLEPLDGGISNAWPGSLSGNVNADGSFRISQAIPGDYEVRVSDPGYYLKESRYGGADTLNEPLRVARGDSASSLNITLSRNVAEVSGRVTDNALQAAAGARVVLVPDRARHRRDLFKQATTDARGYYRFTNVWPGEYKLFAWESIDVNGWRDPEILKGFERYARSVRVRESATETVDAGLITARP
jgi:protocatechuate 3,4-dioxygenase beta subunit